MNGATAEPLVSTINPPKIAITTKRRHLNEVGWARLDHRVQPSALRSVQCRHRKSRLVAAALKALHGAVGPADGLFETRSGLYLVRLAWHLPADATHVRDDHAGLVVAIGVAALPSVLAVLVVGNVTIWRLYWNILPGAKAIRVPSRFLIFATPLLAVAVAYVSF
jgi:hypothetical protein